MKRCKICKKELIKRNRKFCGRKCYARYLATDKIRLQHCSKIGKLGGQARWKGHKYAYHTNGYIMIKVPNHPFANKRGYVYAHRLEMEKSLGRILSSIEVVHHKDGNKENNEIKNLVMYKTTNAHTKFHGLIGDLR